MSQLNQKYAPDYDISSGQRVIRFDGNKYDYLFPKAEEKDKIVIKDGEVQDTLKVIERVVWTYIDDSKRIARLLKRNTTEDTLNAIWDFLYYNIQYKLDEEGLEQLRRPARAWHDRKSGIDCDCFSIFCSSILCNLSIPHQFRITKYSKEHWQHIYVIVPYANQQGYWTVDAVLGQFNYEKPFTQKMDYPMSLNGINIAVLSGFGRNPTDNLPNTTESTGNNYLPLEGGVVMNTSQLAAANNIALNATIFAHDLQGLGLLEGEESLLGAISNQDIEDGLYRYLVATRQAIAENPATAYVAGYNQQEILKMLDYALHYWYSNKRDLALGQLIQNEAYLDQMNGFGSLGNLLSDDELYGDDDIFFGMESDLLGKAKKAAKPAPKAKKAAKMAKKAAAKAAPKAKKKGFFKKVGAGVKKVAKGIVRFNPATIAARNGFLLALKINTGKISEKLKWAYATPEQAKAKGVHPDTINKAKKALAKIEKLFTKIGGKPDNLRKAVLSSKKGSLNGFDALGAAPAAAIAAATPIIVAAIAALKESGLVGKKEQVDITSTGEDEGVSYEAEETLQEEAPLTNEEDSVSYDEGSSEASEDIVEGLGSLGSGVFQFAQNNPLVGIALGGAVAYGIYTLVRKPDKKKASEYSSTALSGTKNPSLKSKSRIPVHKM